MRIAMQERIVRPQKKMGRRNWRLVFFPTPERQPNAPGLPFRIFLFAEGVLAPFPR